MTISGTVSRGAVLSLEPASPTRRQSLLRILESFLVRRFFARVPTNQLNRLFIRLAQQLPPGLDLVDATRVALSKPGLRWPNDAEFRAAILRFPFYTEGRPEQRRLIVETLEASYGHKEVVDLAGLTIEHVMPQTITPEWEAALGDEAQTTHEELLHVLGNLTLTGYNPELSNRPFSEKRVSLAQSNLEMNKQIAQEDTWTRAQIEARTEQLAELAVAIWPGPIPQTGTGTQKSDTGTAVGNGGSAGQKWNEVSLFAAMTRGCSPTGLDAVRRLYDHARDRGATFSFGIGSMPSVTARVPLNGKPVSIFSVWEWPAGTGLFTINFEYLANGGASAEVLSRLASDLREIPGVADLLKSLEESEFKKRPSLPVDPVLTQSGAVEKIAAALDALM